MSKKIDINRDAWVAARKANILLRGVRQNTHKPLSATNKRHPVTDKVAEAIAQSMWIKRGG